jgi:hypothetical protein
LTKSGKRGKQNGTLLGLGGGGALQFGENGDKKGDVEKIDMKGPRPTSSNVANTVTAPTTVSKQTT